MEYLIAVDLEGIGGVVGLPKLTLNGSPCYEVAKENAVREINAAVKALYDGGATKVCVWDNHGGGGNLDFDKIDSRVEKINWRDYPYRLDFSVDHDFKGIIYLGYHAREGTFKGVLAHTYSSVSVQYAKIDGVPVGELEIDSYIAATHGISPIFVASDLACVEQFKESSPDTVFVVTKYGKSRNEADLRDEDDVVKDIYNGVSEAMKKDIKPLCKACPFELEVRFTRAEDTPSFLERAMNDDGVENARYGDDTHTLLCTITKINRTTKLI